MYFGTAWAVVATGLAAPAAAARFPGAAGAADALSATVTAASVVAVAGMANPLILSSRRPLGRGILLPGRSRGQRRRDVRQGAGHGCPGSGPVASLLAGQGPASSVAPFD